MTDILFLKRAPHLSVMSHLFGMLVAIQQAFLKDA